MSARPREFNAAGIAMTATFVGVIAAMGLVPAINVPGLGVPITIQSMGVMLAGAILGRWRGAAAVVVFLLLVAMGLPLLSGGRGGLGVFAGPSVGFLIGFPVAAFVIGWLSERLHTATSVGRAVLANILGGIVLLHILGILGRAAVAHLSLAQAAVADGIFVPLDLVKAVLAAFVARAVHQAMPDLQVAQDEREPEPAAV